MAETTPALTTKKPVSVWQKPLTLDFKAFATALAKAAGHGALGKLDDLADDGVDALGALGLASGPEELAFLLVQRGLQGALMQLLKDSAHDLPEDLDRHTGEFFGHLESAALSIDIGRDFFERPQHLPLLQSVAAALREWLAAHGADPAMAASIAGRLSGYFPYALHREWQCHGERYEPVRKHLDTPFAEASEREQAWRTYAAYLQQKTEEGAFGEPFGLRQIYVPLHAWYEEDVPKAEFRADGEPRPAKRREVVHLEEALLRWLEEGKDPVRVVSGGPGCGKSSFAQMFAARVAVEGRLKVLFVPLHLIDPTRDFAEEIGRFVRDEGFLRFNPLSAESPEPDCLVILDGLDELAGQGQAAASTARDFVRAVQRTEERRNLNGLHLRILFSGRELAVQESQSEFRRPGQILTVLPYRISEEDREARHRQESFEWRDPDRLLERDLRQDWWRNYGGLIGKPFGGLPTELDRRDLAEVNAQPLLNYLLAISFCRGKLDFSRGVNLNQIYQDLVEAVYARGYEREGNRRGRVHAGARDLSREDFFLMLEEVALAAWHGDGRSTTVGEIERHCRDGGYGDLLNDFRDGAERGITRLLAAFFFRQHGERKRGEPTFVFTHKSFGEYLTARRLVRAMERIVEEREQWDKRGRGRGWNEEKALEEWARLCGPTAVSRYLHRFWLDEIALRPKDEMAVWQAHFTRLFSHMLRHGSPMEKLQLPTFKEALLQSRNAEEALLAALNACARVTEQVSPIEHPEPTSFGAWFKRIQGQRSGADNVLAADCLSFLELTDTALHLADLFRANLFRSRLVRCRGAFLILEGADLMWADLSGATLRGADLHKANLHQADLREADLSQANLREANLRGADLHKANLRGADLHKANLRGADLHKANLRGARYTQEQLADAKTDGARFDDEPAGSTEAPGDSALAQSVRQRRGQKRIEAGLDEP